MPQQVTGLLPDLLPVRLLAAVLFGLGIGLVSSLLVVAGGELIIPTLIFAFGVDIRSAGTASLLISPPTVAVGILRHRRLGAFEERQDLSETVVPMGVGSFIGLVVGSLLVGLVFTAALNGSGCSLDSLGCTHLP